MYERGHPDERERSRRASDQALFCYMLQNYEPRLQNYDTSKPEV